MSSTAPLTSFFWASVSFGAVCTSSWVKALRLAVCTSICLRRLACSGLSTSASDFSRSAFIVFRRSAIFSRSMSVRALATSSLYLSLTASLAFWIAVFWSSVIFSSAWTFSLRRRAATPGAVVMPKPPAPAHRRRLPLGKRGGSHQHHQAGAQNLDENATHRRTPHHWGIVVTASTAEQTPQPREGIASGRGGQRNRRRLFAEKIDGA